MSEEKILEIALKQSAEDFGCARRDFFADENVVSILDRRSERARKDLKGELFFDVASFGKNAIVCASRELSGEAYGFARAFSGKDCFGADAIRWLDKNLFGRGLEAGTVTLYFLPLGEPTCPTPDNVRFVFLEKESLPPFYLPQWSNALCEERKGLDAFAVAALCGGLTAGLAGASCDCSDMLQIGVDVLPAFRGRGLGAALTSRLAACIRAGARRLFTAARREICRRLKPLCAADSDRRQPVFRRKNKSPTHFKRRSGKFRVKKTRLSQALFAACGSVRAKLNILDSEQIIRRHVENYAQLSD